MYKQCFKCEKIKHIDEFYKHSQMADGHLGKCKECTKKDYKLRRLFCIEKLQDYEKKRGKNKKRKDQVKNHLQKWRKENPEKTIAHGRLAKAIKNGKVIRPNACEVCGVECILHGHHEDYSKPLDVLWLCPLCHAQIH